MVTETKHADRVTVYYYCGRKTTGSLKTASTTKISRYMQSTFINGTILMQRNEKQPQGNPNVFHSYGFQCSNWFSKFPINTNLIVKDGYLTLIYSTPTSQNFSTMLCDESKLITPPDPTGDWSISQGVLIRILCWPFSSTELLTTGNFSSSKVNTCE